MKRRLAGLCLLFLASEAIGSAQQWPPSRGQHAGVAVDDPLEQFTIGFASVTDNQVRLTMVWKTLATIDLAVAK
jgi:hypothetical protein